MAQRSAEVAGKQPVQTGGRFHPDRFAESRFDGARNPEFCHHSKNQPILRFTAITHPILSLPADNRVGVG